MSSSKEYLDYILDCLSLCDEVSYRAMMGEYILYFRGKVIGGIYDDRFLVKVTEVSRRLLPDAPLEIPYEGAKEMLLIEDADDREFLQTLFLAMEKELPSPKKKSK
ncbi:MAG: TfoX/Sxy family protein [Clostridia bacterium]|nr:TfoX/Sxy family protein [Clostridia bacterium]